MLENRVVEKRRPWRASVCKSSKRVITPVTRLALQVTARSSLGRAVVAAEPDSRRLDDKEEVVDAWVAAAAMLAAGVAVPALPS